MLVVYEDLKCMSCGTEFKGRRPPEGIDILCPNCVSGAELPLIDVGGRVPNSVNKEVMRGEGEVESTD